MELRSEVDNMFAATLGVLSANPSNRFAQEKVSDHRSVVAGSMPAFVGHLQAGTSIQQSMVETGTGPDSLAAAPEGSKAVYHRMTSPQLMSWPVRRSLDPATIERLTTPLHVITSFRNDSFPLYPQEGSAAQGGGLLKIASRVPPNRPAELQQHSSAQPGPASEEPAPNVNWPRLKRRKCRTTFRKEQVDLMEAHFQTSMYLTVRERRELALRLQLEDTQVKTWFQNRRMRWKRQHPEKQLTPCKPPTSRPTRTQVVRPMQCPPPPPYAATRLPPDQPVVPTPPPSVSAPSVVAGNTRQSCHELPMAYPMLPPSPVYNHRLVAPSAAHPLQDNCFPAAQSVYGVPVFPHHLPTGFGMHPWLSTSAVGPHGGAQYPSRHV